MNSLSISVPSGNTSLGLKWPARGIASRHMLRSFISGSRELPQSGNEAAK